MARIVVTSESGVRAVVKTSTATRFSVNGAMRGPAGSPGTPGVTGPAGPQGPAGVTGAQGVQGDIGPQGIQGATGPEGATGPQGDIGPTGPSGTGSNVSVAQTAHGLAVGNAIRHNGTAWVKAKADDPLTAAVEGVVQEVTDANHFVMVAAGVITGLSGLTAGRPYYLSDVTAGLLTLYAPYANATVVKPVMFSTSTTAGMVEIERGSVNVVSRAYPFGGINFGYSELTDMDKIRYSLRYIGRYTNKIRLSIPSWNDSDGITAIRALVLIAKNMGFKTTYGVTAAGFGHDATYVSGWLSQVDTEAAWADANGVDMFFIGNEEDWFATAVIDDGPGGITGITPDAIQDAVLAKAVVLKGLYPDMEIVYSTSEGKFLDWDAKAGSNPDWASLDRFGINMYNPDFPGTLTYGSGLAFGSKMFLSEWSHDKTYGAAQVEDAITDADYRASLLLRRKAIEAWGGLAYMFTFDWGGAYGSTDDWGMSNGDGTFKPGIEEIFSIPR